MEETRLGLIIDYLERIALVLERPVVQRQILAFALVVFLAWLLPMLLDRFLDGVQAARARAQRPAGSQSTWRRRLIRLLRGIEYTFFPLLGLLFGQIAITLFTRWGWQTGLIRELLPVFWLVLVYRLLAGALVTIFIERRAHIYTTRFLTPLFFILLVIIVYNTLAGTFPLGEIVLIRFLDTSISVRALFTGALVFYLFFAIAWITRDLFNRFLLSKPDTDSNLANTVVISGYYAVIAIGILTTVSTLGFDLSSLTIILGGLSVGISFGLQELVANFVSGILLLFEQSLRPGDVIEIEGRRGTVDKLRMRSTVLRTLDNVEIFVPNKNLLTSTVETYTHTDRTIRRMVDVGVSYNSDPNQVRDILLRVAKKHGLVLDDPAPSVFFVAFGPSSLDFQLAVWINDPPRAMQILSDLHFMIWGELKKAGVEIPFPQQDLHIRSGVPWERLAPASEDGRAQVATPAAAAQSAGAGKPKKEATADATDSSAAGQ